MRFERLALAAVLLVAAAFFGVWAAGAFGNLGAAYQDDDPGVYVAVGIGTAAIALALAGSAVAVMLGWRVPSRLGSVRVPAVGREARSAAQLAAAGLLLLLAVGSLLAGGSALVGAALLVPAALFAIAGWLARGRR